MLRVRTVFTGVAGSPWYSNLYFDTDDGTAEGAHESVTSMWQGVKALISNGVSWRVEGEVAVLQPSGEITGLRSLTTTTGQGTGTGDILPPANQMLVQMRTAGYAGGRNVRGRCFIPGMLEGATTSGRPDTNARNIVASAFTSELIQGSPGFSVWSRKNAALYAVTNVNVWTEYAVLRSRRD